MRLAVLASLATACLVAFACNRDTVDLSAEGGGTGGASEPLYAPIADALAKIERFAQGLPLATAEAHPETAQMMIINPLSGGGLRGLFSTHPATSERVARLMAMAQVR